MQYNSIFIKYESFIFTHINDICTCFVSMKIISGKWYSEVFSQIFYLYNFWTVKWAEGIRTQQKKKKKEESNHSHVYYP